MSQNAFPTPRSVPCHHPISLPRPAHSHNGTTTLARRRTSPPRRITLPFHFALPLPLPSLLSFAPLLRCRFQVDQLALSSFDSFSVSLIPFHPFSVTQAVYLRPGERYPRDDLLN